MEGLLIFFFPPFFCDPKTLTNNDSILCPEANQQSYQKAKNTPPPPTTTITLSQSKKERNLVNLVKIENPLVHVPPSLTHPSHLIMRSHGLHRRTYLWLQTASLGRRLLPLGPCGHQHCCGSTYSLLHHISLVEF